MSFMSFIQGQTIHRLGEYGASQSKEHTSQEILGKREFCKALEAMQKWHDWPAEGQEESSF